MEKYNLGIDIGGTFIKYALVDNEYNIKEKWKVETVKFDSKDELYDYICGNIKTLDNVELIGISAPALIDEKSNVKSYAAPTVYVMYGTNINEEISKRTGKKVTSINDAKSAGLCEFKIGNAKGTKSSAFLILGTGTGGCICNETGVIFGQDAFAGEFHHLPFFNFKTGKMDRLGDYASMTGLIDIYNSKVNEENQSKYGSEICNGYLNGEEIAKVAVNEWINNIIIQLITITVFYNPEIICIGGGISEADWFIDIIRKEYKEKCISLFYTDIITTKIDRCKYNNDSNILGAIMHGIGEKVV